jgi:hypothetical protein
MDAWLIRIEAWPHSSGRGQDVDQAQAGPRQQSFVVRAIDARGALERAELIAEGMRTNPMVWRAPITEIRKAHEDERASEKPEPDLRLVIAKPPAVHGAAP